MYRRRILCLLGVLTGVRGSPTTVVGSYLGQQAATEPSAADADSTLFSGTGPTRTDSVRLTDGVTTVDFDHSGESAFRIELVPQEAASGTLLVDGKGDIDGGRVVTTTDDAYVFEVTASGAWTVECAQPDGHRVGATLPPHTDSGEGVGYIGPVQLGRTTEVAGTHQGDGLFSVSAQTATGDSHTLFQRQGSVEERTTIRIEGLTWFDIEAEGGWELEVV